MSSCVNFNNHLSFDMDSYNGFKIEDFESPEPDLKASFENRLYGTDDSETLNGGQGFDYIDGRGGDDLIIGSNEADFILGGDGNDVISGGNGDDIISGGAGNDTFVIEFFDKGVDKITDFTVGEDTIEIRGFGSDVNVDYNQDTGSLSVDGEEIARLDVGLDNFNDDSYEVF